jgi:hypothetical protein
VEVVAMNRWRALAAALLGVQIVCAPVAGGQEYPAQSAPSPAGEPAGNYIVVTALEVDVLAIPATNGEVLLKAVKGDLFPLIGQRGDWYSVAVGEATGWVKRDSAALMFFPEFLDPRRLRESYTPPPYVPHLPWGYWGYPGYGAYPGYGPYPGYDAYTGWWGGGIVPYPWRDPLRWGFWLYERDRYDDDHDGRNRDRDHYGNRPPNPYPDRPAPPPSRDRPPR